MLAGSLFFAIQFIGTKKLSATESPMAVLFWMSVIQTPFCLAAALPGWTAPALADLPWILAIGVGSFTAHYCMTRAMKLADAMVIVPVDYFRLPLIAVVGAVFYAEPFDPMVFLGAAHDLRRRLVQLGPGESENTLMMNHAQSFVVLLSLFPGAALAQGWPQQPITILMGFPAGSGVDVVARLLEEPMEKSLGGKLVMDYRVGAGGNLASEAVAKAKPDGYTLLLGTAATHGVNAALYKKLPFDVEADFTPIAPLVNVSNVLTVNPQVIDASTLREFIDKVKANPGQVQLRLHRQRHRHAPRVRRVRLARGPGHGARAVQGRPRGADLGGFGHHLLHLQPGADRDPAVEGGQGAAAGRHHAHARFGDSRRADHRGGRRCRASRATPGSACSGRRAWMRTSSTR